MDLIDELQAQAREAMSAGQGAVNDVLADVLKDHERFSAALRRRPKPWFFAADDTMTLFCTEGRAGNASAPHDHGTWSVLGCFDGAEESWWLEIADGALRHTGSGVLRAGDVHALPANAIHAVMNRWNQPNGVVHIYAGNFLATERSIWDPVTHQRHGAGLAEPLAPAAASIRAPAGEIDDDQLVLGGTAFAAVAVRDISQTATWLSDAFGMNLLTDDNDSCAVELPYAYLIEASSLTIVGLHRNQRNSGTAGLEHVALRVASLAQLERWHHHLTEGGFEPSGLTAWSFGTFFDVTGPDQLTVRLLVPAVR
jgi:hypothetical protein